MIFTKPVFSINRAAELIDMTPPAANSAVGILEEDGLLRERTGQERDQEFQADEVLDVLNRDIDEVPSPESFLEQEDARFRDW